MKHSYNSHLRSGVLLSALAMASLPASVLAESLCDGLTQLECRSIASRNVYALVGNNIIAQVHGSKVIRMTKVSGVEGNLIGLDFRPAEATPDRLSTPGLYGLSDNGKLYTINIPAATGATGTLVTTLATRFDGGFQSLSDFNPVVNALRLIGSNDQNYAVVNNNGNLNQTAPQTPVTYAVGDPQAAQSPNLTAGAYNNNIAASTTTIFYAMDFASDSLVTIADITNGSSATGGGRLKTIGRLLDPQGRVINIAPDAGMDIYTDPTVGNVALISNGQTLYFLNLASVNISLPVGSTQDVIARPLGADVTTFVRLFQLAPGVFMDIAATPSPVLANPADLSLKETINVGSFTNGQPRTSEFVLTNQGPDSQSNITFSATSLPFKDPVVTTSQGNCQLGTLNEFGRTFDCNIGTLAFGATATIRVTVSRLADDSAGARQVDIQVQAQGPGLQFPVRPGDPDGGNNALTSTVFVNR